MSIINKPNFRKILSVFLTLVMTTTVLIGIPIKVNALEAWAPENFTYDETDKTILTGLSESGNTKLETDKDLVLPSTNIEGEQITKIKDMAFLNKGLTSVVLPDGIQNIGTQAFGKNNLTKVEIPSSVNYLGNSCFTNNQIESVIISKDVKDIDLDGMCFAVNKIKSINLPNSVKRIASNVFNKNIGMEESVNPSNGGVVYMYTTNQKHFDNPTGDYGIYQSDYQKLKMLGWEPENFTYEGTVVTGFSKKGEEKLTTDKNLIIPQTNIEGQKITEIKENAFSEKELISVELPSGLNSLTVGSSAFSKNAIEKVVIPEGVTKLDAYSFIDNKLASLEIPSTVFMLGNSSFKNNQISSVNISKKVNKIQIDANVFASNKIKSLDIPISIEKLTKSAFLDNPGMDSQPGVVYMYTTNQKHFENSRIHHIDSEIEANKSTCQKMVLKEPSAVEVVFVGKIPDVTVEYNTDKLNLNLPTSIVLNLNNGEEAKVPVTWTNTSYDKEKAGEYVFKAKYNLPSGVTGSKPVVTIKVTVKEQVVGEEEAKVWEATDFTYGENSITGLSSIGKTKAKVNKRLVFPDKTPDEKIITKIDKNAFNAQAIFGDVHFEKEAVISPSGFKSVKFPSGLQRIEDSAFQYNNITSLDFPSNIEYIGGFAFNGNKIDKLVIPDTVTEIGISVFGVNPISSVKLSNNLKEIPNGAFTRNTKLTYLQIPDGIKRVGEFAFSGCPLTSLNISKSVERIERSAFNYHKMESINIPGNVKFIGESAFSGTSKGVTLKKLILGEGVEEIGRYAFEIGLLKEVNIPNSIKTIDPKAFKKNTGCEPCDSSGGIVYLYTSNKEHLNLPKGEYHKFIYKEGSNSQTSNTTSSEPSKKAEVVTLTGLDRFDTSIKISKEGWTSAENIVLINDSSIADALSATPFAKAKDAPILLSKSKKINQQTLNEIKRLNSKNVYIVGGEKAVSSDVEKYLKSNGYNVVRIAGLDRYDTSLKIANEFGKVSNSSEIAVVNGEKGLADAVSMGAVAAEKGMPIILTNKSANTNSINEFTKNNKVSKSYIIGGESVLTDQVKNKLQNSERISGLDRKETNAKVIEKFYGSNLNNVYIAKNGIAREDDLVDAISVGVLAAKKSSPVMLVSGKLSNTQKSLIKAKKLKAITQIGGNGNEQAFNEIKELTK